jgi:hypothetical protein
LGSHPGISACRAILVLGMHRSGTSALTRTLGLCGAALPLNTVPAGIDNETGFWEPQEIVHLHDEILQSAGSSWDDATAFPQAWFDSALAADFKARIAEALERDFPDAPALFVVKDPRLCRLVPLWLSMFQELGIEPLCIIPVRNPLEIAASLSKRNSIQEENSLLLWLRHFLAAEQSTRNCKRSFVAYDSLLRDWRGTIDRIGQDIGVIWPCQTPESDAEITQFISTEFRHHQYADNEVYTRKNVAEWVKTVFSWALRAAHRPPVDSAALDAISGSLDIADVAFMPIISYNKLAILNLAQDVRKLTELQARKDNELRQLQQQLHDQLQSSQTAVQELRSEVAAEANVAKQLQNDLQSLREEAGHRADEYNAARVGAESRINCLRAAYDQSQSELALLRSQHERIITSTSWRAIGLIRSALAAVPSPVRRYLRRGMKLLYWIATPQKTRQRLAFLRARQTAAALPLSPTTIAGAAPDEAQATADLDDGLAAVAIDAVMPASGAASSTPASVKPGPADWPPPVPSAHCCSPIEDPDEMRQR